MYNLNDLCRYAASRPYLRCENMGDTVALIEQSEADVSLVADDISTEIGGVICCCTMCYKATSIL